MAVETSLRTIVQASARVISNTEVIPNHKVLVCHAPELAAVARPGHFVNSLASETVTSILRKPFSIYKADPKTGNIALLYQVRGATTYGMARKVPGDLLDLVGPLGGHVFDANPHAQAKHVMVGGGYGVPPLVFLGKTILAANPDADVHFIFGARSQSLLLCQEDVHAMGATLDACTDDGSFGIKGRVTEALQPLIESGAALTIYTCGPTPMMRAVAEMSVASNVLCQVSLEVPMPCGVGVCMGCVVDTADSRRVRACTEGPVFKAEDVVW